MSFGDDRDLEENAARDRDRRDTMDSAENIVDGLNRDGRRLDAACIGALLEHCRDLVEENQRLRALKGAKGGRAKDSGGKDRATASGTINGSKGSGVGVHKHDYGADGRCKKTVNGGFICTATRQRQSKKSRQTTIPGTDGGGAKTSEASP